LAGLSERPPPIPLLDELNEHDFFLSPPHLAPSFCSSFCTNMDRRGPFFVSRGATQFRAMKPFFPTRPFRFWRFSIQVHNLCLLLLAPPFFGFSFFFFFFFSGVVFSCNLVLCSSRFCAPTKKIGPLEKFFFPLTPPEDPTTISRRDCSP